MSAPIDVIRDTLAEYAPNYDPMVAEVVMATIVANKLKGPPVWLMLVAPPSVGKTIVLEPLEFLPNTALLSKITDKTLISGAHDHNGQPASLLLQLGNTPTIVIKDLGILLQTTRMNNTTIFGQFREMYDGHIDARFGTGKHVRWPPTKGEKGKITLIVGMTPAVDLFPEMRADLGERFIRYRFESDDGCHDADLMESMGRTGEEDLFTQAMLGAYRNCVAACSRTFGNEPRYAGPKTKQKVLDMTQFLRVARTTVNRNKYRNDAVELQPTPEGGYRLIKILLLFANALCILRDEDELSDLAILQKIAFDTIEEPRRSVLKETFEATKLGKVMYLRDYQAQVSDSVLRRTLKDLAMLQLIAEKPEPTHEGPGRPKLCYEMTSKYLKRLC